MFDSDNETIALVDLTIYAKQIAPPTFDDAKCVVAKPADVLSVVEAWCLVHRPQWVLDKRDR